MQGDACFINAGSRSPAPWRRSTFHGDQEAPSMVGKRSPSTADEKRPKPVNPLAVKHKVWYSDCPRMVGGRPIAASESRSRGSDRMDAPENSSSKAGPVQSKKEQSSRCEKLSKNEPKIALLPGQLLVALDEAEDQQVSSLRQKIRQWLKSQTQSSDFVTLNELERHWRRWQWDKYVSMDGEKGQMGVEQFHKVAQEELMAMILTLEGSQQREFQLAYTQWHKEKDRSRQKEEYAKIAKHLQRQEEDITRRSEKVKVVEEATGQYLEGITQRKSRKFWPTSSFMREMNTRVKKKLAHQKFNNPKQKQKTNNEPTFSTF